MARGDALGLQINKHGMTVFEIADELGCSHQAVSMQIRRTLRKLKGSANKANLREFLDGERDDSQFVIHGRFSD